MAWDGPPPPERVETPRLVLRAYTAADAPLLKEATESSLEHLRPFMPWAHHLPQPLEDHVAFIASCTAQFATGEQFVYGIFDRDDRLLGGAGLHARVGPGGLEIGYWVRADRTGRGIATEATAALTDVGFEICGVDRVELHIEPTNAASLAVPRKLGYREEALLRRRLLAPPGEPLRDAVIFTLFREDWSARRATG